MIHVLSMELFGRSIVLPDFVTDRRITGIGMSDWGGYALPLSRKFNYRNTYYHTDPKLDITCPPRDLEGTLDFIITTDVFEHIAPPVSVAFINLRKLLKPTGVVVFTVPYGVTGTTIEHYPDLHDYTIQEVDGRFTVHNVTRDGVRQVFHDPVFHGGPGTTLEMRVFSESSLIEAFRGAGFNRVTIHKQDVPEYGILWESHCSLPISARP